MLEHGAGSILLAASIAAATPGGLAAPPVTVTGCDELSTTIPLGGRGPSPQAGYRILTITFVNRSPLTARHVRFAVGGGSDAQIVDAFGRFSTGIPIEREFEPARDANFSGPGNCSVEAIDFADGSTWKAP